MIAFVDELYELTGTGQWDAAAERLTDDFVAIEADGLPMEGPITARVVFMICSSR
jgi:hypothetical protein